jgi:cell wall-associated NlpC family hydrolase
VPSQPLNFGELLLGGVLATMGITGASVRDVLSGKAGTIRPIAAGHSGSSSTASAGKATSAWLTTEGGPAIKGATPGAERLVKIAESQKGVQEGSEEQAQFASAAGISAAQAWCAAFATWCLKKAGVTNLPADPASVSSWESWAGGIHIESLAKAHIGDLLAFNGEHIGIYLGKGMMISGNWSDEVAIAPVSEETEPLTAIIRVKGLGTEVLKTLGRGGAESLGLKGKARV